MGSLIIFTDAGAPVDPRAADISAHGARCNADLGIVANALHLAGISFGINIENSDGGRVAQYIPSEPDGSGHTDASTRRAALTPPALQHPQRASGFAQFPAHCVSRVANPPYRLRQALLRDAELVSPVLYFVGLQEADAGPVRRSSLAGIVCHVCRAPFVGA